MELTRNIFTYFIPPCRIVYRNSCSQAAFKPVRVRFAPSPTGLLHLGGLRTALYNYLFAKSHNGKFILRLEDTDQTRIVPKAAQMIESDLKWAGLHPDESPTVGGPFCPYVQSERLAFYSEHVQYLLDNGSAYRCFCTERRLDLLRREAMRLRQIPRYDNKCRNLSNTEVQEKLNRGEKYCIRFQIEENSEPLEDLVYGTVVYNVKDTEGDPVIMKSDGFPTYHFANVVDDHLMEITHVLRGVEWQPSTPKHLLLYRAFGWTPPVYAHLPLLMNEDGSKLSKRQGDIDMEHFRKTGILPLALLNYVTLAGGGFHRNTEKLKLFTMQELVNQFDLSIINVNSGCLQYDNLMILNNLDLQRRLQDENELKNLINELKSLIAETFKDKLCSLDLDDNHIKSILLWSKHRVNSLQDFIGTDLAFIWVTPSSSNIASEDAETLEILIDSLQNISQSAFTQDCLKTLLRNFSSDNNIKFAALMKTLRHVLSGLKEGPGVAEMMEILGKDRTLSRIEHAVSLFRENNNNVCQNVKK